MNHFRTTLTAKAEVVKSNSTEFKAVASSLKETYGFDLKPQMDLMYVRSCLVSAGTAVGVNENDDIFTREEAWAARHTPVLKPFNWQHEDKDIVGVMYTVQARTVDGDILDISDESTPDCDFDLYVEAAIFRLIHEDRAAEIESRSKGGTLYVSMEAWFDDYSYGLFNSGDNSLEKTVARNEQTSFLDKHLRANSGIGTYCDPESNQDMRIGRVLRSITFGGCGFVDRPANKRSTIEVAEPMSAYAEQEIEAQIKKLLKKVLESQTQDPTEVTAMNTQANSQGANPEQLADAITSTLDAREKAAAQVQEQKALKARAAEAETKNEELTSQVTELTEAKEAKDAEVVALESQMTEYGEAVDSLIQENTTAGATDSTPSEIAAIDAALSGDAAFAAKLSWLQKSMASLQVRAARATELEAQLAEAESVVREQEVRTLFSENFSEEAVEIMVSRASSLSDDDYASWRDEKELMLIEVSAAAKKEKKELPAFMKKGKEKKEEKDAKAGENPFADLLAQRKVESAASPDTPPIEPGIINHPGGEGVKSGVTPASPGLSTPRHKIAGSAGDDLVDQLENAQADGDNVSLAGSQVDDNGAAISPFRVLASVVTDEAENDNEGSAEKPSFDPVNK